MKRRTRTLFIACLLVLALGAVPAGAVDAPRPSMDDASRAVVSIDRVHRAVSEREAISESPGNDLVVPITGSASGCVRQLKQRIRSIAAGFVDRSKATGGTFNEWFATADANGTHPIHFPMWSAESLLTYAALPSDAFDRTPWNARHVGVASVAAGGIEAASRAVEPLIMVPLYNVWQTNEVMELRYQSEGDVDIRRPDNHTTECDGSISSNHIEVSWSNGVWRDASDIPVLEGGSSELRRGAAVWSVGGTAVSSENSRQSQEDYSCYQCGILAHIVSNDYTYQAYSYTEITKQRTVGAMVYVDAPAVPHGSVALYARYSYEPTHASTNRWMSWTDCSRRWCTNTTFDHRGIPTGTVVEPCGWESAPTNKSAIVPAWNPGYRRTLHAVGDALGKPGGVTILETDLPGVSDVSVPLQMAIREQVIFRCDTRSSISNQFCSGSRGADTLSSYTEVVYPDRTVTYSAEAALLTLDLEYPR